MNTIYKQNINFLYDSRLCLRIKYVQFLQIDLLRHVNIPLENIEICENYDKL